MLPIRAPLVRHTRMFWCVIAVRWASTRGAARRRWPAWRAQSTLRTSGRPAPPRRSRTTAQAGSNDISFSHAASLAEATCEV